MIDIKKLRKKLFYLTDLTLEAWVIEELLDRLEAAESDALEQARLNGMGSEREAALMAKLEAAERERDALRAEVESWGGLAAQFGKEADKAKTHLDFAKDELNHLRAKIEAMERQEPYSYIYEYSNPIDGSPVWRDKPGYWNAQFPKSSKPLYLAPGAQPAPSVPVDVITDYLVSISAHVAHQEEPQAQAEIGELLRMLAAAPEAKP